MPNVKLYFRLFAKIQRKRKNVWEFRTPIRGQKCTVGFPWWGFLLVFNSNHRPWTHCLGTVHARNAKSVLGAMTLGHLLVKFFVQ